MTKSVRIENADATTYPVRVTGQYKNAEGEWVTESSSVQLDAPCNMTTAYITDTRRLVIEELAAAPKPGA